YRDRAEREAVHGGCGARGDRGGNPGAAAPKLMAEPTQPSEIAREALRRLAARRLQPTPANYRNLYHESAGTTATEQFPERALKTVVSALPRESGEQQRFARQMEAALAARDWNALKSALVAIASRPVAAAESAREARDPARTPAFAEVR